MGNERVLKLLVSTSVAGWIADQNWQKLVFQLHTRCGQVSAYQVLSFSSNLRSFYLSQFTTKSITMKMKQNLNIF
jgi:hypothetical protein